MKFTYTGLEEDKRLVQVVPTTKQMMYHGMEFNGFIHFTINTFTGKEWGDGTESPEIFNPEQLDAEQWVLTAKNAGMRGLILTCKHHDGFCLWPSKYTEHSVKNSPYKNGKGDIVREVSEACKKHGIQFGVYLSPWDRNHHSYGQGKAYDDFYISQLTELLTEYGDIFVVWLDGACGEGPNGKRQAYDWNRYYAKVRELQPKACIAVSGPDVRWCGNEAGKTRESEWSVVPAVLADPAHVAEESQQEDDAAFREKGIDCQQEDLGSREKLKGITNLVYYPSETDLSVRPGWFYHEEEDDKVRPYEKLKDIYLKSVGGNGIMLLNMPPDRRGLLHENDIAVLRQLGEFIKDAFGDNLLEQAEIKMTPESDIHGHGGEVLKTDSYETYFENPEGLRELTIDMAWEEVKELNYLVLKEAIIFSQRVEVFEIWYEDIEGEWKLYQTATVIGYKKIMDLGQTKTKKLRIQIKDARVAPILSFIGVYGN